MFISGHALRGIHYKSFRFPTSQVSCRLIFMYLFITSFLYFRCTIFACQNLNRQNMKMLSTM